MKVSVVVPAYNAENTLAECLDSVINQTFFGEIEINVIDDGSVDSTAAIVQKYMALSFSNRVINLYMQDNKGVSSARNFGIEKSTGDYIAFLDSDDFWHSQKLEIIIELMVSKDLSVLGHGFYLDSVMDQKVFKSYHSTVVKRITMFSMLLKNFSVTPAVVVKTSASLPFNSKLHFCEDHELWVRTSLYYSVFFVDLPLVKLGRVPCTKGGVSDNKIKMRLGEMKMYICISKLKPQLYFFIPLLFLFSISKFFCRSVIDFFKH